MYRLLNRLENSLEIQQQLEKEYLNLQEKDGYVQEELGETRLAMGQAEKATPYFAKAFKILSQDGWLVANEAARLKWLQKLGDL